VLDIDVPDSATLQLTYEDGFAASVSLSLARRDRSRGFEFAGELAAIRFNWSDGRLEVTRPDGSQQMLWAGKEIADQEQRTYDPNAMYRDLLDDFLTALEQRTSAPIRLSAGLESSRVCRAVPSE
jgi:predicted dehydrogenase